MLVCVFRDLPLHKGEIITLLKRVDENWYEGLCNDRQGFLPANYVEVGISSTLLLGLGTVKPRLSGLFDYPDIFLWSQFFHKY